MRMLHWFLLSGTLVAGGALIACGDDDDPAPAPAAGGGAGAGGTTGTGGTSTGGTSAGGTGTGGTSAGGGAGADGQCLTDCATCSACCFGNHQTGAAVMITAGTPCMCGAGAAGAAGAGACNTECAADLCADPMVPPPSGDCLRCGLANCMTEIGTPCGNDPDCADLLTCLLGCSDAWPDPPGCP